MLKIKEKEWNSRRYSIHGSKYICLDKYIDMHTFLNFKCKKHGIFKQTPNNHLRKLGCPSCKDIIRADKLRGNIDELVKIALSKNGVCLSKKYFNCSTKYKFKCQNRHTWNASGECIKAGTWCPSCSKMKKKDLNYLKLLAKQNNGKCLSETYSKMSDKYLWECNNKHRWFSRGNDIQQGCWCPLCVDFLNSKGIKKIREFLEKNNIEYINEHTISNCKNIRLLRFDIYLPNYNSIIEYDGEQHFNKKSAFNTMSFNTTKINDNIKNKFCLKNNITLIRIPYTKYKQINEILLSELKNKFSKTNNYYKK